MSKRSQAGSLLILWWLAGISPGFLSVPPASLGHTIVAMPAVYILMALPLTARHQFRTAASGNQPLFNIALSAISLLLLVTIGWRDLSDYFKEWPSRGMVRFLYRADIHDVALPVLRHRLRTNFNADAEGVTTDDLIRRLIDSLPDIEDSAEGEHLAKVFRSADAG